MWEGAWRCLTGVLFSQDNPVLNHRWVDHLGLEPRTSSMPSRYASQLRHEPLVFWLGIKYYTVGLATGGLFVGVGQLLSFQQGCAPLTVEVPKTESITTVANIANTVKIIYLIFITS